MDHYTSGLYAESASAGNSSYAQLSHNNLHNNPQHTLFSSASLGQPNPPPSLDPAAPVNVDPFAEQALQLELLRETRRIRELELRIAEASRRESEERRKEREAELALAQLSNTRSTPARHTDSAAAVSTSRDNGWTAPTFAAHPDPVQLGAVLDASQGPFMSQFTTTPNLSNANESMEMWFDPLVDDVLNGFYPGGVFPAHSNNSSPSAGSSQPASRELATADEEQSEGSSPQPQQSASTEAGVRKRLGKVIQEKDVICTQCGLHMAKMILRGSKEELAPAYDMVYRCLGCEPGIVSGVSRKRTNEMEDTNAPAACDVCTRIKGHGGFVARGRTTISFTAEMICLSCSEKYRRCTNCGGTSARGVIGKWRCKELFSGGRKTCSLSHARLGTRDMEMATWEAPTDLQDAKELPSLLECCEQMWREHVLSRLAVPEVLEHQTELKTFAEIEAAILYQRFPGRELFTKPPKSPNHRRFVSFAWAKIRTRRDKSTPEWAQTSQDTKRADQWLAYNMRRSTVLLPSNSMLCGAWLVEWVIPDRTFVVDSLSPFGSVGVDERGGLHCREILRCALAMLVEHNTKYPDDLWPAPEHLWVVMKNSELTARMRVAEGLQRHSFLPLDEYLARHTTARKDMFRRDVCALAESLAERRSRADDEIDVLALHMGKAMTLEALERRTLGQLRSSMRKAGR